MTSALYAAYETSKPAESNGIWCDDVGGSKFKLARMGGANVRFQKALAKAMKPFTREIQLGLAENEVLDPVMREVFIETVLLDWEGVTGRDGAVLPFSKEAAEKLFADLPDLYTRLREQAQAYTNFRAAALQAVAGN